MDKSVERAVLPKPGVVLPDYLKWAKILADYLVEIGVPDSESLVRSTITNVRREVRERGS